MNEDVQYKYKCIHCNDLYLQVEEAVDDVFEDAIPEADEDEDAEHVTLNFGDKRKEDGDVAEKVPLTKIENDIKS